MRRGAEAVVGAEPTAGKNPVEGLLKPADPVHMPPPRPSNAGRRTPWFVAHTRRVGPD